MKSDFLLYLLRASICLSVFYGLYQIVLHGSTFYYVRRAYLLITPALALAIPLVRIQTAYPAVQGETFPAVDWNALPDAAVAIQRQVEDKPDLMDYLWAVYCLGSLLFACMLLLKLIRLAKLIRTSRFESFGLYKITHTRGTMPTFSFLHYLFWNDVQPLSAAEEDAVLRHELTHITEKHTVDILYIECLRSFLWFNPVIWLYRWALPQVHELLADRKVTQKFGKDAYATLLKRTLLSRAAISLSTPLINHSRNEE